MLAVITSPSDHLCVPVKTVKNLAGSDMDRCPDSVSIHPQWSIKHPPTSHLLVWSSPGRCDSFD